MNLTRVRYSIRTSDFYPVGDVPTNFCPMLFKADEAHRSLPSVFHVCGHENCSPLFTSVNGTWRTFSEFDDERIIIVAPKRGMASQRKAKLRFDPAADIIWI